MRLSTTEVSFNDPRHLTIGDPGMNNGDPGVAQRRWVAAYLLHHTIVCFRDGMIRGRVLPRGLFTERYDLTQFDNLPQHNS